MCTEAHSRAASPFLPATGTIDEESLSNLSKILDQ